MYKADKLHDCYNFIKNAVNELPHTGNFICVEDDVVFKMARDYFIDILPAIDVSDIKTPIEVAEKIMKDAAEDKVKRTELGFEVFGEEDEEPEEAEEETAEEPCDQEDVGEEEALQPVAANTLKYDEEGNGLLFDM